MTTVAQLIREMNKQAYEYRHGRIVSWPNLWAWKGKYPCEPESYPTCDNNGRIRVLVRKTAIRCSNVDLWDENEWYFERKEGAEPLAWLPASFCRKCPHYMKADKRGKQRWPRCKLDIAKRKNEHVDTAGDAMKAAIRAADELMSK